MEQIFRIEIPVEAIDKTDAAALQRLETALQKIINGMKQNRTAATEAFDAIDRAAASTASSLQRVESANADVADSYDDVGSAASDAGSDQTAAASEAESANTRLEDSVSGVGEAYEETASAAAEAGERPAPLLILLPPVRTDLRSVSKEPIRRFVACSRKNSSSSWRRWTRRLLS